MKSGFLRIVCLVSFTWFASSLLWSAERVYMGEKACRECHHLQGHRDQFNPWHRSAHARAFACLSSHDSKAIARLSGIDQAPSSSPICLGCHATASASENWERDEKFFIEDGVQCEFCHGPGSDYMEPEIMADSQAARRAGLKVPTADDCMVCHVEKGSHLAVLEVKKFDVVEAFTEIRHYGRGGQLTETESQVSPQREGPKLVGAFFCARCHDSENKEFVFSKWRLSRHAEAYSVLGTPGARQIARDMKIEGHPQKSPKCLKCHTTGRGDAWTSSFDKAQGVQCESCHGPGSDYWPEAIMLDPVAAQDAGLKEITRETCLKCHGRESHGSSC